MSDAFVNALKRMRPKPWREPRRVDEGGIAYLYDGNELRAVMPVADLERLQQALRDTRVLRETSR